MELLRLTRGYNIYKMKLMKRLFLRLFGPLLIFLLPLYARYCFPSIGSFICSDIIANFIVLFVTIFIIVTIVQLLFGVIGWLFSRTDQSKIKQAKDKIRSSLIEILLIPFAWIAGIIVSIFFGPNPYFFLPF